ncbi:unnamed protein product [Blepharisma stoltei]|uniref:Uncharacterized protein n=1 Tax=Blepharisma stoltei TaxID=1481888 RepID=A0AAU9J3R7_9CILI|nr:unnamed protein product [Blepharisma stoltei]
MLSSQTRYTFSEKVEKVELERSFRIKSRGSESRETRHHKKLKRRSAALANSPSMSTNASLLYNIQNQSTESISSQILRSKPPRVPPLLTKNILLHKCKEKSERSCLTQADDLFFLNEYKKIEIIKTRQVPCSKTPFWFQDMVLLDISSKRLRDSNRCLQLEDLVPNDIKRSDFTKWVSRMNGNRN